MSQSVNNFHKRIHNYHAYGEAEDTQESRSFKNQKHKIEIVLDEENKYYVKKYYPYSEDRGVNFYFDREVNLFAEAQNKGYPFARLVEFEYPTKDDEGYIITKYMEGGSVMKQINLQNGNNSNLECTSSDTYFDDSLPHFAKSNDDFPFNKVDLTNDRKMIIIYGTAEAISFLQKNNIVHRDIKPENIILHESEPYLTDFGLAREVIQKQKMSKVSGSTPYIAPEIIRNEEADISADIYSFGVTMIMILSGKLTITLDKQEFNFYEIKEVKQIEIATKGIKYNIAEDVPPALKQFIYKCCDPVAGERPKIKEILDFLRSDEITSLYGPEYQKYIAKFNKK